MRIAQVAPLYESVPPKLYGGTERVVSYLAEELVRQGHEVTVFASADSVTSAKLVPCAPRSLRLDPDCKDPIAPHVLMVERVLQARHDFDVIHFHIDSLHYPSSRQLQLPALTTMHGLLDLPEHIALLNEFAELPVVSISHAQRRPVPNLNWVGNIYHGLPAERFRFHPEPGGYLAFLGRISPEKRVDRAIEIAKRTGMRLRIAAKVGENDRKYFQREIEPLLDHPLVEFLGEISEDQKEEFLGNAYAFLFPIDWAEPFGLVMIESLACGTPVIAYSRGSVPEVLDDGVSSYIVDNLDAAVDAVRRTDMLSRRACRAAFEERFTTARMAQEYLAVYQRLAAQEAAPLLPA